MHACEEAPKGKRSLRSGQQNFRAACAVTTACGVVRRRLIKNATQPKNHPTNQQSTDYQEGPGSEGYSIITSPHAAARFSALNKQLSSPIRRQRRRRRRRPSVISQFRGGGDLDRSLVARALVRTTPNFGRLGAAVLWMYVPTHGLCCTTNLRPLRTPAKTPWSVVVHGGSLE